MQSVLLESFDRDDFLFGRIAHYCDAGSRGLSVHVDRTRAAKPDPAAKFRSRQPQTIAQIPEQRHLGVAIERPPSSIHLKLNHCRSLDSHRVRFPCKRNPSTKEHAPCLFPITLSYCKTLITRSIQARNGLTCPLEPLARLSNRRHTVNWLNLRDVTRVFGARQINALSRGTWFEQRKVQD